MSREIHVKPPMVEPLMIGMLIAVLAASAGAAAENTATRRGKAIVTNKCSHCHAVGRTGASPHPQALPLRSLGKHYPIESLEETLGEGILSGHPDMPELRFRAKDVGAIIAYLRAIQDR